MVRHDHLDPNRPLRRFGQNFLVDPRVATRLVELFAPGPADFVVEIGAGRGALTSKLAARAGRLVAIELDRRRIDELQCLLQPHAHAELMHADALSIDWDDFAARAGSTLRVIGNLPYNIGTALVRRLIASDAVRDIQVVLQLEVVDRIVSPPGRRAYGPLSILCALRCNARRAMVLSPGVFKPRPKVRSAVLVLARREPGGLPAGEIDALERWLFRGFASRRKTLAGNIPEHRERVRDFLSESGLPPDARAEAVPPGTWLALARQLECWSDEVRPPAL